MSKSDKKPKRPRKAAKSGRGANWKVALEKEAVRSDEEAELVAWHAQMMREVALPPHECPPVLTASEYRDVMSVHAFVPNPSRPWAPWSHTPAIVILAERLASEIESRALMPVETLDGPPKTMDVAHKRLESLEAWIDRIMEAIGIDHNGIADKGLVALLGEEVEDYSLDRLNPPPPEDILPLLDFFTAVTRPYDFLPPLPSSILKSNRPRRLKSGLDSVRQWLVKVGDPKNLGASDWMDIELKLHTLFVAARTYAFHCSQWVRGAVEAFKSASFPSLSVAADGTGIEIFLAGRRRTAVLPESFERMLLDKLLKGKGATVLRKYRAKLRELLPELDPFIYSKPTNNSANNKATYFLEKEVIRRSSIAP